MMIDEHISLIVSRRKELGLSQEKLARLVEVSRVTIANIEQGLSNPSWKLFYRICEVLKIKIIMMREFTCDKHLDGYCETHHKYCT